MESAPGGPGIDAAKYLRKLIAVPIGLQKQYPVYRDIRPGDVASRHEADDDSNFNRFDNFGDENFAVEAQEAKGGDEVEDCNLAPFVHQVSQGFVENVISTAVRRCVCCSSRHFGEQSFEIAEGDESAPVEEDSPPPPVQDAAWIQQQLQDMKVEIDEHNQAFIKSLNNHLSGSSVDGSADATEQSIAIDGPNDKGIQCSRQPRRQRRSFSQGKPKLRIRTPCGKGEADDAFVSIGKHSFLRRDKRKKHTKASARIDLSLRKAVSGGNRTNGKGDKLPLVFTEDGRLRAWRTPSMVLQPKVPDALRARLTPCL